MRSPRRTLVLPLVLGLLAALVAVMGPSTAGAAADPTEPASPTGPPSPGRPAPSAFRAAVEAGEIDAPRLPPNCFGPGQTSGQPEPCPLNTYRENRPTVLLWGDSHAYQFIPALREAVKGRNVNLVSLVAGSCPPVAVDKPPRGQRYDGKCEVSNYVAMSTVKSLLARDKRVKVVLGSNWAGFRIAYRRLFLEGLGIDSGYSEYTKKMVRLSHEGTPQLFTRLGRLGVDVDVIAQAATVPALRTPCAEGETPYRCDLPRWRAVPEEQQTERFLDDQMAKLTGKVRYVETKSAYCDTFVCHGVVGDIDTYFDDLHLSATRTRALGRFFRATVDDLRPRRTGAGRAVATR